MRFTANCAYCGSAKRFDTEVVPAENMTARCDHCDHCEEDGLTVACLETESQTLVVLELADFLKSIVGPVEEPHGV